MSAIVGYIGKEEASPFLLEGLTGLEYLGYDSAGIAVLDGKNIVVEKTDGKLSILKERMEDKLPYGNIGVGHLRLATHGGLSEVNTHPHMSNDKKFAVVQNGIIENYLELKEELMAKGYKFASETDTEVVVQLMQENYDGDFTSTARKVFGLIEGSYSLVLMSADEPDKLVCMKRGNSLIIGLGEGENFVSSEISILIAHTRRTYILADNELAIVKKDAVEIQDRQGQAVNKEEFYVKWDVEVAEKKGYEHFMLKEIHDQPQVVRDNMLGRVNKNGEVDFMELKWDKAKVDGIKKIFIIACGTAWHAGLLGKYYIEQLAHIPVETDLASEFRYRLPLVDKETLVIVVSQSGETSDTLEALKEAKRLGAQTLAITNVVDSSMAHEADDVLYTYAGREIAIASTKAYTAQVMLLLMFAVYVGRLNGVLTEEKNKELVTGLQNLSEPVQKVLENIEPIKAFVDKCAASEDIFFIGRALDYAVALEGSLKLKETSYIHAAAYAAGELKHGTMALLESDMPIIALAVQPDVYDKTVSNIQELKARGAVVFAVAAEGDDKIDKLVDYVVYVPEVDKYLAPILTVVPLQLLAYNTSVARGCDVDTPRNLVKSVTVE